MGWEGWVAVAAAAVSLVAMVVGLAVWRRLSTAPAPTPQAVAPPAPAHRVAFVVNPSKQGVDELRYLAMSCCSDLGLAPPLFLNTTVEDPGSGQAREALGRGADAVIACGGDGTVRAVAQAMAGSGVPMGLVPLGTGNLLARNLGLPLSDVEALVRLALAGTERPIDVGRVDVYGADGHVLEERAVFLVIAGIGFDAAMVADTDPSLKKRVGWMAYFVAGARHLHSKRLRLRLSIDRGTTVDRTVRTLMVGNCGKLPGGLTLIPDAELDDGQLDLATVDTRGGLVGWASLLGQVLLQGVGLRKSLPYTPGTIRHERLRRATVRTAHPQPVQLDGEVVGPGARLDVWVDPHALIVRVAGQEA